MATRRHSELRAGFDDCRAGACTELHAPSRDRNHIVLYVGVPHLFERHSGSPSEVDLRSQLCAGHAGSVCVLFRLFFVLYSMVEDRKCNWLPENHGGGIALYVGRRISVCAGGVLRIVPAFPGSADCARSGHHRLAGSRQPLRGGPRKAGDRFEPLRPDTGV